MGKIMSKDESRQYKKKILAIAVPIMLSNLISQLQMLIDRIFLGRLNIRCMSAVGNASTPMWTTMSVVFSLGVGSAILISQEIGAGNKEKAKEYAASLFKYANLFSIVLYLFWALCARFVFTMMGVSADIMDMCVSYANYFAPVFLMIGMGSAISIMLQVSEKTGIMIVYGVVRSVANIILDYALIFGNLGMPRMEVKGAALATTIAEYAGDLIILIYVIINKELWLKPNIKEIISAKLKPYIATVLLGIPTACEDFAWNFGNIFLISMLNQISVEAAGIYSIVFGVELIPVVIISSLGNATLTFSGQETGRKNYSMIMEIVKIVIKWCFMLNAFILLMFIIFPKQIVGWFTTDVNVIAAAAVYMVIVGIDLFPKSGNIIVGAGIKGYGDTKWMLGTQIFGTFFVISMSAFLVLVLHQGIAALFCMVVADETIRSSINLWKLKRIVKKTE